MTKIEILNLLNKEKTFLKEKFKVKKIGLFGSYAKNIENKKSDIDIYVEFYEKNFDNISGLWVYLENKLNKKVDLYYPNKFSNGFILNKIKKEVLYG